MDKNNTLRIILYELQELQRRYLIENKCYKFSVCVLNTDSKIQFLIEFSLSMTAPTTYCLFDSIYPENVLQETLKDLKHELDKAIKLNNNQNKS